MSRDERVRSRPRGFTLLEAVVALAILAAAGLALFAAMSQSLQMVGRAQFAAETDAALRNAVAWTEQVNPMEQPEGEQSIGRYLLRWTSEPVEPPRDNTTDYLEPGLYEVGLYRMHLELWRDGTVAREALLHRVGFRQVREPPSL